MPRERYVLRGQTRKMVYNVMQFMKKENEEGIQIPFSKLQKRVAAATDVSVRTVQNIAAAANESGLVFRTPGKKRKGKKRVTGVNSFDQGVIKRCVHNFHVTEKELPTTKQLQKKLKADINFNGSTTSLGRILRHLGFQWKKTQYEKRVLIEKSNIRLQRIEYLQKISAYRSEGRPIIYTAESYVDHSKSGERIVIVHAGFEAGFVPNALMMFKADKKSGDHHDSLMNYDIYEKWMQNQLIPNLPANSVVAFGNASYHIKQDDPAPTSDTRKVEMQSWLREKNISFDDTMLKPQLYKLIAQNKDRFKKFCIDETLKRNNHLVIRFPPCHADLNPLEMVWVEIKQYIANKNVNWQDNIVMELVQQKVNEMGENEWGALCQKVKIIEEEYKKSDAVIDRLTDEFVINAINESDSDSEEHCDSSDGEESSMEDVHIVIKSE